MKKKYLENTLSQYFEKYISNPNTVSIVITGSYGRNENDFLSDIDWVLIVKERQNDMSGFKEKYNNIDFDCRIEEYSSLKNNSWCMDQYFAYFNCKIYYDKNFSFKKLQDFQKEEWHEYIKKIVAIKLVECSVFLKFPNSVPDLVVEQTHFEKFIARKDYYSAYNCLNIIKNQLIDLCYIANGIPIPDVKNRLRNISKYSFSNLLVSCCKKINKQTINELNNLYKDYKVILKNIIEIINKNYNYENNLKLYYYKYRGVVK